MVEKDQKLTNNSSNNDKITLTKENKATISSIPGILFKYLFKSSFYCLKNKQINFIFI
jgi:hypothetical protein